MKILFITIPLLLVLMQGCQTMPNAINSNGDATVLTDSEGKPIPIVFPVSQ